MDACRSNPRELASVEIDRDVDICNYLGRRQPTCQHRAFPPGLGGPGARVSGGDA